MSNDNNSNKICCECFFAKSQIIFKSETAYNNWICSLHVNPITGFPTECKELRSLNSDTTKSYGIRCGPLGQDFKQKGQAGNLEARLSDVVKSLSSKENHHVQKEINSRSEKNVKSEDTEKKILAIDRAINKTLTN